MWKDLGALSSAGMRVGVDPVRALSPPVRQKCRERTWLSHSESDSFDGVRGGGAFHRSGNWSILSDVIEREWEERHWW